MTCRIVAGLRAIRYLRDIVREATGSTVVMYTCTIASNIRCSRGVSMASMRASCLPRTECEPPRHHLISGTIYCNIDCPGLQSRLASETWRNACLAAKLQLDI